jgi:hypothetical protein
MCIKNLISYRCLLLYICIFCLNLSVLAQIKPSIWKKLGVDYSDQILNSKYATINVNENSGLISLNGDTLIRPIFQSITFEKNKYYKCQLNTGKMGLYNDLFKIILEPKYDLINILDEGIQVKLDGKISFFNHEGVGQKNEFYDQFLITMESGYHVVASLDHKNFGVYDKIDKNWIIKPIYESIVIYQDHFIVANKNYKSDIFNHKGEKLNKHPFHSVLIFCDHFIAKIDEDFKPIIYDTTGNLMATKINFGHYSYVSDTLLFSVNENQYSVLDRKLNLIYEGNNVIPLRKPIGAKEGVYFVSGDLNKLALVKNTIKVTPSKYLDISVTDSFFIATHSEGIDILDTNGNIKVRYPKNIAFVSGSAIFQVPESEKDSIFNFDIDQNLSITPSTEIEFRGNYLVLKSKNLGSTLMDLDGKIHLQNVANIFFETKNRFRYIQLNKYGWFSPEGVVKAQYDEIKILRNDKVVGQKDMKWYVYNLDGSLFIEQSFDHYTESINGLIATSNDNKYYLNYYSNQWQISEGYLPLTYTLIGLKVNGFWQIYNENTQLFDDKKFRTMTNQNNLITADNAYYFASHQNDQIKKFEVDTAFVFFSVIIGKKDSLYCIINSYDKKYQLVADSVKAFGFNIYFYKNGKVSFYNSFEDFDKFIKNVDEIKYQTINSVIARNGAVYDLYFMGTKVMEVANSDIMMEIEDRIFSFEKNDQKYIFDVILDSILVKKYDFYTGFSNGYYSVENNFEYGLLDPFHNLIIPCQYENDFSIVGNNYIKTIKQYQSVLYDLEGKICIPMDDYEGDFTYNKNYIFAKKGGYYGYYDIKASKWNPSSKYQDIKDCNIRIDGIGDLFIFVEKEKYGIMNEQCNVVLSSEYDEINTNEDKFFLKKQSETTVVFLTDGFKKSRPFTGFEMYSFNSYWVGVYDKGFSLFYKDKHIKDFIGEKPKLLAGGELLTHINFNKSKNLYLLTLFDIKKDKALFEVEYISIRALNEDRFLAQKTDFQYILIDSENKILYLQAIYDFEKLNNNLLKINVSGKFGVIDYDGNVKIEPKYANFKTDYSTQLLALKIDTSYDVFNKELTFIKSLEFDYIGNFKYGHAPVRRGIKWGYIDTTFNITVGLEFDYCHEFFDESTAFVCKDKTTYNIDLLGKIRDFDKFWFIDLNEIFIEIINSGNYNMNNYQFMEVVNQNTISAALYIYRNTINDKYGFTNIFFDEVIPASYEEIQTLFMDIKLGCAYAFKSNGKWGIMNHKGKIIENAKYDLVDLDFDTKMIKVSFEGHSTLIPFPK